MSAPADAWEMAADAVPDREALVVEAGAVHVEPRAVELLGHLQ